MKNNNKYKQITQEERVIIADLWRRKKSYYFISKWIKRKYDTVKNEIERNGKRNQFGKIVYYSKKAQKKYLERRRESKFNTRIIENNWKIEEKLVHLIFSKNGENMSLKKANCFAFFLFVCKFLIFRTNVRKEKIGGQIVNRFNIISHQTIYNWIYRMEDINLKKKVVFGLRRKGRPYRKSSRLHAYESKIAPKIMIDKRPEVINKRKRLGDFEGRKANCLPFLPVSNEVRNWLLWALANSPKETLQEPC